MLFHLLSLGELSIYFSFVFIGSVNKPASSRTAKPEIQNIVMERWSVVANNEIPGVPHAPVGTRNGASYDDE